MKIFYLLGQGFQGRGLIFYLEGCGGERWCVVFFGWGECFLESLLFGFRKFFWKFFWKFILCLQTLK